MIEILVVNEKISVLLFVYIGTDLSCSHLRAFHTNAATLFIDDVIKYLQQYNSFLAK